MILNGGNLSYDYALLGIDIMLMLEKYQAVKAMSLSFAERWCNSQPTDAHCAPLQMQLFRRGGHRPSADCESQFLN